MMVHTKIIITQCENPNSFVGSKIIWLNQMQLTDWLQTVEKCRSHTDHACYCNKSTGRQHYILIKKSRQLPTVQLQQQMLRQEAAASIGIAMPIVASGPNWYVVPHNVNDISLHEFISKCAVKDRVTIIEGLRPRIRRIQKLANELGLCDRALSATSLTIHPPTTRIYITNLSQCATFAKKRERLQKMQNTIKKLNEWKTM